MSARHRGIRALLRAALLVSTVWALPAAASEAAEDEASASPTDDIIVSGHRVSQSSEAIGEEPAPWLVANFSGRRISKRYANFTNSFSVPGHTVWNAYVDLGDGIGIGPIKNLRARLNIDNVFDKDALSFISPQVTTGGLFRPLTPRTVQFTVAAKF